VVDPERFTDDALEPMAARGMGAVYMATSDGAPLRGRLDASDRAELLARFYDPHHARLEAATESVLDATGHCLLLDAHSFPDDPLPCDLQQDRPRPEICIGIDPFHTPARLEVEAAKGFEEHGLCVAVNRPYAGALVPARWYQRDERVSAVMIEINRRLYMDEATGQKSASFEDVKTLVQSVLNSLVRDCASQ
jgi:N-formylglutamate amidohydrolase